jgi:hypothetical protein
MTEKLLQRTNPGTCSHQIWPFSSAQRFRGLWTGKPEAILGRALPGGFVRGV